MASSYAQQFLTNARESVESVVPQVRGKRVLLYAPTFRGRVASAEGPDQLDIAGLKAAVGGDFVLLIKHHPFVKQMCIRDRTLALALFVYGKFNEEVADVL